MINSDYFKLYIMYFLQSLNIAYKYLTSTNRKKPNDVSIFFLSGMPYLYLCIYFT